MILLQEGSKGDSSPFPAFHAGCNNFFLQLWRRPAAQRSGQRETPAAWWPHCLLVGTQVALGSSLRSALCLSSGENSTFLTSSSLFSCAVGGEIPLDMRLGGGQLVSEELMNLGESFTQTNDPSLKLFQCAVCNKFTTDNLDMLGLHMNVERSLPEDEWKAVMGDSYQCKLCRYNTQLKANFQLHCKTDKHVQKYQLVAHIKEGGKANEWRLKCVAIGNPVHLKCNACDYYTNSLEKLRLHTVNSRHEASLKLYKVRVGFASSPFPRKIYVEPQWAVTLWR